MTTLLSAQTTRGELLFALQSAIKAHDVRALEECFDFDGAAPDLIAALRRDMEQIAAWPASHVFTSERADTGALKFKKDGKNYTLNGDWTFQIHIHRAPPPSKGFVFPAGRTSSGKYRILLAVEME